MCSKVCGRAIALGSVVAGMACDVFSTRPICETGTRNPHRMGARPCVCWQRQRALQGKPMKRFDTGGPIPLGKPNPLSKVAHFPTVDFHRTSVKFPLKFDRRQTICRTTQPCLLNSLWSAKN